MRESIAKTKWCFCIRISSDKANSFTTNRNQAPTPVTNINCLGSGCMAWRIVDRKNPLDTEGFCGAATPEYAN